MIGIIIEENVCNYGQPNTYCENETFTCTQNKRRVVIALVSTTSAYDSP